MLLAEVALEDETPCVLESVSDMESVLQQKTNDPTPRKRKTAL